MTIIIGIIIAFLLAVFFIARAGKNKASSKAIFDGYLESIKNAAEVGERAYRAQMETLGAHPNVRGIALARLATSLFPVASYAIAESSDAIPSSVTEFSPVSGKDVWNLASGIALQPLGNIRGTPHFSEIKEDTHYSINQFINLINSTNVLSSSAAIEPAIHLLSPIWCRAFEISGVPRNNLINGYAAQYVTSGMLQLLDVYDLLATSRS
ncbi:hypothetical protein H9L17_07755 [Thermomonas brevis]|uniref:Uncharacterized protein n=1 Tax=Thermomonas brevis TaxID=215691 RepID=A0A7G9QXC9_9GAMM|nr:hypothetical protein [Thermomonas brevis]QNN48004.1 hypothetical protein H9L17_07755 [Thermomonas brevis]